MTYRKLRIAWSVGWGLAAVLLIVLWVRSYWIWDSVDAPIYPHGFSLNSDSGQLTLQGGVSDCPIKDWSHFAVPSNIFESFATGPQAITVSGRKMTFSSCATEFPCIFSVPHWLAALPFATVAIAPWVRRFSLRTLLIATTLVAVVLGLVVWAAK